VENHKLHLLREDNVKLSMEVDKLKKLISPQYLNQQADTHSSLTKINVHYNKRDNVPGLNLAKLKV